LEGEYILAYKILSPSKIMPSYFISQQVLSKTILKIWRAMSNEEGAKSNRPRLMTNPTHFFFWRGPSIQHLNEIRKNKMQPQPLYLRIIRNTSYWTQLAGNSCRRISPATRNSEKIVQVFIFPFTFHIFIPLSFIERKDANSTAIQRIAP
jgi:hypothetical protein